MNITLEDLEWGLEDALKPATEAKHKGAPELTEAERKQAIKIFSNEYVGKFPMKLCHSNSDGKHDRIIAEIDKGNFEKKEIMNFMVNLVQNLNKKQDAFTFFFSDKGYVLYANEPKVKEEKPQAEDKKEEISTENFMVADVSNTYMVEEFASTPMVKEFVSKGLSLQKAVLLMEARLEANPFLPMMLMTENMFATEEEYDQYLFNSFAMALEHCDYKVDLAADMIVENLYDPFDVSKKSIKATTEAVVQNRGKLDKMKHDAGKAIDSAKEKVSPYVKGFLDQYNKIMGEEAAKEEILHGGLAGWLLSWRRLFLKLIIVWKSAGLMSMAVGAVLGFPWGFIVKGILLIGRLYTYFCGAKALAGFSDEQKDETKKALMNELELELRIAREKIDDAKSAGDNKAKYELMRVENKIQKEIFRIKYNRTPGEFRGE